MLGHLSLDLGKHPTGPTGAFRKPQDHSDPSDENKDALTLRASMSFRRLLKVPRTPKKKGVEQSATPPKVKKSRKRPLDGLVSGGLARFFFGVVGLVPRSSGVERLLPDAAMACRPQHMRIANRRDDGELKIFANHCCKF